MKDFFRNKLDLYESVANGLSKNIYPCPVIIPEHFANADGDRLLYSYRHFFLTYPKICPFHLMKSDTIWQYSGGESFFLHTITRKGIYKRIFMGPPSSINKKFIHVVPANDWQAAQVNGEIEEEFSLMLNFSIPAFDIRDRTKGTKKKLIELFPKLEKEITPLVWDESIKEKYII